MRVINTFEKYPARTMLEFCGSESVTKLHNYSNSSNLINFRSYFSYFFKGGCYDSLVGSIGAGLGVVEVSSTVMPAVVPVSSVS
jgi:hypothetical protein